MYTKTTIYTGIIKKNLWFIYIKELLVQKYWQLISTKQLWWIRNIVSSKSRTVQYRVPRCPGQYRNVQDRVPRCPGTEMWLVVLWLGCRCRLSVNTICGRIMVGLSLSSVSKQNRYQDISVLGTGHLGTRCWTYRYWKFRYWTSRYWKFRYWIIQIIWLNLKAFLFFFTCRRCLFRYWIIQIIWLNLKPF